MGIYSSGCFVAGEFEGGHIYANVVRRARHRATQGRPVGDSHAGTAIPLNLSLHVICRVLDALDYTHNFKDLDGTPLNLVYRSVSAHDVVITHEGHVKLLDTGIGRLGDADPHTPSGNICAIGVILWEALTGKRIWPGLSDVETLRRASAGQAPPPSAAGSDVDPTLEAICVKALPQAGVEQIATFAQFRSALQHYLAARPRLSATPRELGKYVEALFASETRRARPRADGHRARRETLVDDASSSRRLVRAVYDAQARRRSPYLAWLPFILVGCGIGAAYGAHRSPANDLAAVPIGVPTALLSVSVFPPEASVYLDGVPLAGRPPTGAFKIDHARHRLFAQSAGYVGLSDVVVLDCTRVAVTMTLERQPSPDGLVSAPPLGRSYVAPATQRALQSRARRRDPIVALVPSATAEPGTD